MSTVATSKSRRVAVDGNVTAWSGDLQIDGQVDGDVTAMAGDIESWR